MYVAGDVEAEVCDNPTCRLCDGRMGESDAYHWKPEWDPALTP